MPLLCTCNVTLCNTMVGGGGGGGGISVNYSEALFSQKFQ